MAALLLLSYRCSGTLNRMCLIFLRVPWVGLQCVIVVFPDHTLLLSCITAKIKICETNGNMSIAIRPIPSSLVQYNVNAFAVKHTRYVLNAILGFRRKHIVYFYSQF